eukprot:scaffold80879_cov64-Attheya_sp.AAC.1
MAVIAPSRSVTAGTRIPSINDLTESTQLKPYCRPGCSVKKRGTETQIEITRRETHGLEKRPSQPCGLVERPIAPWPSVAASAQPHQSHSTATAPSRLMVGISAKALPIASSRRVMSRVGTSAKALPIASSSRCVALRRVMSQNVFTGRPNRWTYTGPLTQYK